MGLSLQWSQVTSNALEATSDPIKAPIEAAIQQSQEEAPTPLPEPLTEQDTSTVKELVESAEEVEESDDEPSDEQKPVEIVEATNILYSPSALRQLAKNRPPYIVEGFIPAMTVGVFAGFSAIGKSPFVWQLATCIAAGIPFLGFKTRKGRVLVLDYENTDAGMVISTLDNLAEHLGLPEPPEDNLRFLLSPSKKTMYDAIKEFKPDLILIDALRGFDPEAESDNTRGGRLVAELQKISLHYKTAVYFIHHLKKEDVKAKPQPLKDCCLQTWFQQISGASAIVNQTSVRVGFEAAKDVDGDRCDLWVRGMVKLAGEVGPWPIERIFRDADGEAIGYNRKSGVDLLKKPEMIKAYNALPKRFSFTDAKKAYGRAGNATTKFLSKAIACGILKKAKKLYVKISGENSRATGTNSAHNPLSTRYEKVKGEGASSELEGDQG